MAEFLWTFAVQEALTKVVTLAAEQIGLAWGFEKDLEELKKWLLNTEAFLCDINARKLHHNSVRLWVDQLQHLVHQTDDLLDELVYEDLRRKAQTGKMKKKVSDIASSSNNPLLFRVNMANRIKDITSQLREHYGRAGPLGMIVGSASSETEIDISQLRETVSELDDFEVVGRDVEVSSIVNQVVDARNSHVTSILPIVGVGGLGKTTLAKLVFHHERIKQHFDKTIWVCVSEPFDINKILEAILQNLKGPSGACDNREVLLRELKKEMCGKRYFLVLDDVWNENSSLWGKLKNCLMRITKKSENSIVVTTRSAEVAKIMETLPSHHLSKLSEDQCWFLFQKSANANELPMTSSLKVVREELVKKIGGIPLVAKVWGRAIEFQGNYDRWVMTLESEISKIRTPSQEEKCALDILKLSVDRLPSFSLKQCFAYCSNFSKDFVFEKEQLILMWMAQGFIHLQQRRSNKTMEDEGDRYFKILLSRCLFQDVVKDDMGRIIGCKMHDLIHDIAHDVSNDHKLQYSSNSSDGELWTNENKKIASKLRTIIYDKKMMLHKLEKVILDKMMNFVCLRVLMMNSRSIHELPNSIGKLKHLRYLDISGCLITKLPKSIALLYNLQTLNIEDLRMEGLPKNLIDLVNLRHFKFSIYLFDVKKMPPYFGKLTQLQTLSNFVVGFENGCKITELGLLKNLKGSLELFCLEQVESKEEATSAKLAEKENLEVLSFNWSEPDEDKDNDSHRDLEVLEGLQPHKNLQSLEIKYSASKSLPNNIFVENLKVIRLWSCKNCERLPMLGQLTNLKELAVDCFDSVRSIGNEFYGNECNQTTLFPQLKRLSLVNIDNLEQWEEVTAASNLTTFPRLDDLCIFGCPMLMNIPDVFGSCDENSVEHLRGLNISHCDRLTKLPNGLQFCHSIEDLRIENCSNLTLSLENKHRLSFLSIGPLHKLPEEFAHLNNLRSMKISGWKQDYDFRPLMHLPSLRDLHLCNELRSATHVPQQIEHCTTLQYLAIEYFECIEALPEWLGNLTLLKELHLYSCENLKQLPSREAMLRLTKLRYLYVDECPELYLYEGHTERAKLSHLPEIEVCLDCRCYFEPSW